MEGGSHLQTGGNVSRSLKGSSSHIRGLLWGVELEGPRRYCRPQGTAAAPPSHTVGSFTLGVPAALGFSLQDRMSTCPLLAQLDSPSQRACEMGTKSSVGLCP